MFGKANKKANSKDIPAVPSNQAETAPNVPEKIFTMPVTGEGITSFATNNTYTIGEKIGEGDFGVVYSCKDVWENYLAVKVLKPRGSYEKVKASFTAEFQKLIQLRNPFITFVYDAFEYRDTFYIVTERCYGPITELFSLDQFNGQRWVMPIARSLLQAINYIHINNFVHQDIHPGNVFAKNKMNPEESSDIQFKLGDLGVAKLLPQVNGQNTCAKWMTPPELLSTAEFGPIDYKIDIYHAGLLLLQLAYSKEIHFTQDEILNGYPREMALALPPPYSFALEKALRRHTNLRTANAMELWRDLHTPNTQIVK